MVTVVAACGSDDDRGSDTTVSTEESAATTTPVSSGSETGGGGAAEAAAKATAELEPYLAKPTSIGIDVPLDKPVPAGKKVAWLEANVESVQIFTPHFKEAVKALGWELEIVGYDQASPQSLDVAMTQAVTKGADFIACTGCGSELFPAGLQAAKAAGVPIVQISTPKEADGAANGLIACIACDDQMRLWGKMLSNWVISDGEGAPNVAYFTLPDFAILAPETEVVKQIFAECETCTLDVQEATTSAFVAGEVPQQVVSYVQTHPDTEYIYFGAAFGMGVRQALDAAGIGQDVKIVTLYPSLQDVADIGDGKLSAAATLPTGTEAYAAVDAMARYSIGMDPTVSEAEMPTMIWTPTSVPRPAALFDGPDDFSSQFEKLWGVA